MPQAVIVFATWVAAEIGAAAVAVGTSIAVAGTIADIAFTAVEISVYVGLSVVAGLATAPHIPKPGSVQVPIKQAIVSRRSAFGRVRIGGVYALFEAVSTFSVDVLALLDGRSHAFVQFYLNDDLVTFGSGAAVYVAGSPKFGGGPPGHKCFIYHRLGLDTETSYTEIATHFAAWDNTHRGDGVTSLALICEQSRPKDQATDWPNGVPTPSAVIDAQLVYDPRDGGQIQGDASTYAFSDNAALCLLAYLTDASGGMGLDYASHILPQAAAWSAAADDCDAAEATATGTEARYRCAGTYLHDNAPGEVIEQLLSTFDGFMAQAGDGALILYSGRYYDPTVTLGDREVRAYTITHFLPDEQATNQYVVSFTDPDTNFNTGDAGTVDDTADQTARGLIRSQQLDLAWVPSASQAIRLAKRKLARTAQPLRGSVTCNLMGMGAASERYVRLQVSDNAAIADVVVEITGPPQIDLSALTVTFPWIAAETTIDDGDPGAGVTPPGAPGPRPSPDPLDAPTITALTAVYDNSAAGIAGARILIDITSPLAANVAWLARWRVTGATDWHESPYSDIDDGAAVQLLTGFVQATGSVDVEVAYSTSAQTSPWSATSTLTLAAPSVVSTTITASEDIVAPALVNIWNSTGAKVRKASATAAGKEAHGFVLVSVLSGAAASVHFVGSVTGLSGLTPGDCYLDTTAGGVVSTAPSASGNVVQSVGQAISATALEFEPGDAIELT